MTVEVEQQRVIVPQRPARRELSLFDVVGLALRHWKLVAGFPLLLVAVTISGILLKPREYLAEASFMPQAGDNGRSTLSGLAAQFGVALPAGRAGPTSAFYASVVRSRTILRPVAEAGYVYPVGRDTVRGTLVELIGPQHGSPAQRLEKTLTRLHDAIGVSTQLETGIVRMGVTARTGVLAHAIARQLLDQLSAFDLERRRTQAASERIFIEERLAQLGAELRKAEEEQEVFLRRNRDIRNSPDLQFANSRLARDVSMRQQVYTSFAQAYEQARIDEVRNTPVLAVIEQPYTPVQPRARGLVLWTLLALVAGFLMALGLAATLEYVRLSRARDPEGVTALSTQLAQTRAELRRALRSRSRQR